MGITNPYNLQNITNSTDLLGVIRASNEIVSGWWGIGFLVGFWIIAYISMGGYPTKSRFPAATFLATILAFLLRTVSLVPDIAVFIFIILAVISNVVLVFVK